MIGQWYRIAERRKWHICESVIDGDIVTRCGRRLQRERGFVRSEVMPLTRMIGQPQLCDAGCQGFTAVAQPAEDRLTL